MADGSAYAYDRSGSIVFAFELATSQLINDQNVGVMHIASAADWVYKGHKVAMTQELFDQLVARFALRKAPLSVDYFHGSAYPDPANPEKSAAAGWIYAMWRQGEGADAKLMASVEWTERAAKMIRAKEMRFASPEFGLLVPSPHTGERGPEMIAVALTNRPFQDNVEAIKLERRPFEDDKSKGEPAADDKKPAPDSVPEGDKPAAEGDKPKDEPAADAPAGNASPAADAAGNVKDDAAMLMEFAGAVSKELGIDLGSTIAKMQQGLTAIVSALGGNMPQANDASTSLFVRLERDQLADRNVMLLARVAELETKVAAVDADAATKAAQAEADAKAAEEKRIADHVQMCIDQGRVHIGRRDKAIEAFRMNWDLAESIFADVVVPLEQRAAASGAAAQNLLETKKFTRDELTEVELAALPDTMRFGMTEEEAIQRIVAGRKK